MIASILVFLALMIVGAASYFSFVSYKKQQSVNKILSTLKENKTDILLKNQSGGKKEESLKWKLAKAGVNKEEYQEIRYLSWAIGVAMSLAAVFVVKDQKTAIGIAVLGVSISIFFPSFYLSSATTERAKKIDLSLSTFLDLVIIILEAGGGLNNALKEVSKRCKDILSRDLLTEIAILQTELGTYSSEVAYNNLIKRTGSKQLANFVHFLKLAEETGIGVKTIFETQSKEIKDAEFFEIEKKAAVTNLYLTMIVFMFILPALGGFIVFPMMADALMPTPIK